MSRPSPDEVLSALQHTPPEGTDIQTMTHFYILKNAVVAQTNELSRVHQSGLMSGLGLGVVITGFVAAVVSMRTGLRH